MLVFNYKMHPPNLTTLFDYFNYYNLWNLISKLGTDFLVYE